jgi:hypothetical protein
MIGGSAVPGIAALCDLLSKAPHPFRNERIDQDPSGLAPHAMPAKSGDLTAIAGRG